MSLYPEEEIYRESAFVAYYLHWSKEEILGMPHRDRRAWCAQISDINRQRNPSQKKQRNIFELGGTW